MSVLLDALKKAAKERKVTEESGYDSLADRDNDIDNQKSVENVSFDLRKAEDVTANDTVINESHSNEVDTQLSDESSDVGSDFNITAYSNSDDSLELEHEKDSGRGEMAFATDIGYSPGSTDKSELDISDPHLASIKMSQASSSVLNIAEASGFGLFKKVLFIVLIPFLFFIIVFYSALQWYSSLDDEFESKFRNYRVDSLYSSFKKSIDLGGKQEGVSSDLKHFSFDHNKVDRVSYNNKTVYNPIQANSKTHTGSDNVSVKKNELKHAEHFSAKKNQHTSTARKHTLLEKLHRTNPSSGLSIHIARDVGVDERLNQYLLTGEYDKVLHYFETHPDSLINHPDLAKYKALSLQKVYGDLVASKFIEGLSDKGFIDNATIKIYVSLENKAVKPDFIEKLLRYFPDNYLLYLKLSEFYLVSAPEKSIQILRSAASRINNYYIYYNLANIYKSLGDYKRYQEYIVKAMALSPDKRARGGY